MDCRIDDSRQPPQPCAHVVCQHLDLHLKLPRELGADWFRATSSDGDAASNTLSWRWVADCTPAANAISPAPTISAAIRGTALPDTTRPHPTTIAGGRATSSQIAGGIAQVLATRQLGLIVTDEDPSSPEWLAASADCTALAAYFPRRAHREVKISQQVTRFRYASLANATPGPVLETEDALIPQWTQAHGLNGICLAVPTTGHWDSVLPSLQKIVCNRLGSEIHCARHWWDDYFYPQATHGFFRFGRAIPGALQRLAHDHAYQSILQ